MTIYQGRRSYTPKELAAKYVKENKNAFSGHELGWVRDLIDPRNYGDYAWQNLCERVPELTEAILAHCSDLDFFSPREKEVFIKHVLLKLRQLADRAFEECPLDLLENFDKSCVRPFDAGLSLGHEMGEQASKLFLSKSLRFDWAAKDVENSLCIGFPEFYEEVCSVLEEEYSFHSMEHQAFVGACLDALQEEARERLGLLHPGFLATSPPGATLGEFFFVSHSNRLQYPRCVAEVPRSPGLAISVASMPGPVERPDLDDPLQQLCGINPHHGHLLALHNLGKSGLAERNHSESHGTVALSTSSHLSASSRDLVRATKASWLPPRSGWATAASRFQAVRTSSSVQGSLRPSVTKHAGGQASALGGVPPKGTWCVRNAGSRSFHSAKVSPGRRR